MPDAIVNIFGAPPVEGLGTAGGFKIIIAGHAATTAWPTLQKTADNVVADGRATTRGLQGLFTSFRADTPWLDLIIDRAAGQGHAASRSTTCAPRCKSTSGSLLRQRLQPLRPHLAGQRAGPATSTASRSTISSSCKVRNSQGDDGAAGDVRHRCATSAGRCW